MSKQSYKVNRYTEVKNAFKQIESEIAEAKFSENRDTLAMNISFTYKEKDLNFYYIFGNSQAVAVEFDEIFVLPTEANSLMMKMKNMIEAFVKKVNKMGDN